MRNPFGLSGQRPRPGTAVSRRHSFVAAALLLAWGIRLLGGGEAVLRGAEAAGLPGSGRGRVTSEASEPSADTVRQDRALRQEQLQAAQGLEVTWPRDADALYVAGFAINEQGDSTAAIRLWEAALEAPPETARLYQRADACYSLGYAYLLREDFDRAVACLREALRLNPGRQEARYRLAHALFLAGQMEASLEVLDQGRVETPLGYRLRGQVCQQLGQLEAAKRSYETAVQLQPDFAEAYYGLATTCARLGEAERSREYREKFDALKSDGQAMGRQARTDFDPLAVTRHSLAQTHTEVGRVYAARGEGAKAERLFLRAAEVDPGNTACRFQLVMLYQQTQRNEEALRFCQEMVRAEPRNAFHYLGLGNLHVRLKHPAEAEAAFKKVIELAPKRSEGYFALAQFYVQARLQPAEAVSLAQRAVALVPAPVNFYVLSQACAQNGDAAGARTAIEQACALDPQHPQYAAWRASLEAQR